VVEALRPGWSYRWAFENYKNVVETLVRARGARTVLELGGGGSPLFGAEEIARLGVRYTVNDISEARLSEAPESVCKACFDVGGDRIPSERFDFVFSKMLMEHVRNGARAHRNVFELLEPGGLAVHFFPTLYAPPFVLNKLLPLDLSRKVLGMLVPYRVRERTVFPAYYSWCYGRAIGYARVRLIRFYDTNYLDALPVVRTIHTSFSRLLALSRSELFAYYAYCIVEKGGRG
jgi:SAM-dependent methyltransferase